MSKDWIWNGIFTALATITSFLLDLFLEAKGVTRTRAIPIATLASAIVVGILLRLAVTTFPLRSSFYRRKLFPAASIEGLWLEILNRRGDQHYSIVNFFYDPNSRVDPFSMKGTSFFPDGKKHSRWGTRYTRVEKRPNKITVEYVFSAERPDQPDRPRHGYGESRFAKLPAKNVTIDGTGFYIAAEEATPFLSPYKMRRIDNEFKRKIGAHNETLEDEESEERFVRLVHAYYTDPQRGATN